VFESIKDHQTLEACENSEDNNEDFAHIKNLPEMNIFNEKMNVKSMCN